MSSPAKGNKDECVIASACSIPSKSYSRWYKINETFKVSNSLLQSLWYNLAVVLIFHQILIMKHYIQCLLYTVSSPKGFITQLFYFVQVWTVRWWRQWVSMATKKQTCSITKGTFHTILSVNYANCSDTNL